MYRWQIRPPRILRCLFPGTTWRMAGKEKRVFITFDDGPVPEVTPKVVELLNRYNAKATFFCVADNVRKYPDVYKMLIDNGMGLGNHTYSHMKAWRHSSEAYFKDVELGREWNPTRLFRPPYGQLYPWYFLRLRQTYQKVVMWDVLSHDFRGNLTSRDIFEAVVNNVRKGSIIVFHDSLKAWPRLERALPDILENLSMAGYEMALIDGSQPA